MKGLSLLIIASFLFLTSSCSQKESKEEFIFDKNEKQIIFFSDEKDYENETSYYDAIIELKRDFPNEMKNMKIITANNAEKYFNRFDIKKCPALLLVYQEKILVKVYGEASKEQIVTPLSKALAKNKE